MRPEGWPGVAVVAAALVFGVVRDVRVGGKFDARFVVAVSELLAVLGVGVAGGEVVVEAAVFGVEGEDGVVDVVFVCCGVGFASVVHAGGVPFVAGGAAGGRVYGGEAVEAVFKGESGVAVRGNPCRRGGWRGRGVAVGVEDVGARACRAGFCAVQEGLHAAAVRFGGERRGR